MSLLAQIPYLSPEDYLEREAHSPIRNEYRNGVTWGMSGASNEHVDIVANLLAALHTHLKGTGCKARVNDTRIRAESKANLGFYYPDLVVSCAPQTRGSTFTNDPKVIIEVLSPSTARLDRGAKWEDYAAIPSLEEYVLVDSRTRAAWVYRKSEGWALEEIPREGALRLKSLKFQCAMDQIYEDVDLGERAEG